MGLTWQQQEQHIRKEDMNQIVVIAPRLEHGTWVFDDPNVGLVAEPFVAGVPEIINKMVADIPYAKDGFAMTFSAEPFPGHSASFTFLRSEDGGSWYRWDGTTMEGWLCPALFRYFDVAPKKLYVLAAPKLT